MRRIGPAGIGPGDPQCDLCGGSEFATVYRDCEDVIYRVASTRFEVVRCSRCGLAQTRPRPESESMAGWYDAAYSGWSRPDPGGASGVARRVLGAPHRARYGHRADSPSPPRDGARVVEVGSGDGERLRAMAAAGWDATGVEPFAEASDAGDIAIVRSRAEDVELPEGEFDLVLFPHSLEHLFNPLSQLGKARSWLRPDGRLRVAVPNFDSLERRVFGRYWNGLDVPRHLNHFSRSTLRSALEASGFRVLSIEPQLQGSSFGGSLQHVAEARGRKRPYRPSGPLYLAGAGVGSLMSAAENAAFVEAVAVPASSQPERARADSTTSAMR